MTSAHVKLLVLLAAAAAVSIVCASPGGVRWPSSDADRFSYVGARSLGGRPVVLPGRDLYGRPRYGGRQRGGGRKTVTRVVAPPTSHRAVTNRLAPLASKPGSASGGGARRCPLISTANCPPRPDDLPSLRACSNDAACPEATRCCYHPCLTLSLCLANDGSVVSGR